MKHWCWLLIPICFGCESPGDRERADWEAIRGDLGPRIEAMRPISVRILPGHQNDPNDVGETLTRAVSIEQACEEASQRARTLRSDHEASETAPMLSVMALQTATNQFELDYLDHCQGDRRGMQCPIECARSWREVVDAVDEIKLEAQEFGVDMPSLHGGA